MSIDWSSEQKSSFFSGEILTLWKRLNFYCSNKFIPINNTLTAGIACWFISNLMTSKDGKNGCLGRSETNNIETDVDDWGI